MGDYQAFVSYAHADDRRDGGRIKKLIDALSDEYGLITGTELEVFFDIESLQWGDDWRRHIETALVAASVFIPIITPAFFRSQECRRELIRFAGEASHLGLEDLILPIMYVDVPEMRQVSGSGDEAMRIIAERQWENFAEARLADQDSATYRGMVNKLAKRLVAVVIESPDVILDLASASALVLDESPGWMDLIEENGDLESQLAGWTVTLDRLGTEFEKVARIVGDGSQRLDAQPQGAPFSVKMGEINRVAKDLDAVGSNIRDLGQDYAARVVQLGPIVGGFLEVLPDLGGDDEANVKEQLDGLETLVTASRDAMASVPAFLDPMKPIAKSSREMRRVITKIEQGLLAMTDAQAVIDDWGRQIDSARLRANS